MKVIQETCRPY